MKIGIIGGTFDPIHYAHLLLAESARETLGLDRVIFIPAAIPPHKQTRRITDGRLRAAMIRAAVAGIPEYDVSTFEIDSGGVSYTVETLRYLRGRFPGDRLILIVGSDTLCDIPNWYKPREICRLASIAAARRPDSAPVDYSPLAPLTSPARLARMSKMVVPMPLFEISSTEIRRRVAAGGSVRFLTPEKVVRLIRKHGLYLSDGDCRRKGV
ncbi:MAG: nicotinate-nucleotide adenylyltransferase [Thermoguttaceae bacterium]|nr:nicotinate-nucleotide adenylyltransferase [Thermoguttaceae bacterium]MBR5414727.1 nicotinate-nucleotide adenylyltransferase [Thermoguttaceae bacterium]